MPLAFAIVYLSSMRTYTDQLGNTIKLSGQPKRIISLVPSQTELLFDLELYDEVVGVTKFCVHPAEVVKDKEVIGGTKNFNFDKIAALKPDLIIANKEENYKEGIDLLRQKYPVWVSDISTLDDAFEMMSCIGDMTGREHEAARLERRITNSFRFLRKGNRIRTAYLIWRDPYMTVGSDTFIHHLMARAGFVNVFENKTRYPSITEGQLSAANPELIMLSSEPFPFTEKHREEFRTICPNAEILLVDGELFSWYGSRLKHSAAYLQKLKELVSA
jgi:ABC-type Fe3+-hydroxamate transport system substrate-binding protein